MVGLDRVRRWYLRQDLFLSEAFDADNFVELAAFPVSTSLFVALHLFNAVLLYEFRPETFDGSLDKPQVFLDEAQELIGS